ncbi:MFS transporter [Salicola sp. Rm-C-2C1-2]|uniref:MFS transporter n=1 Tax=Salicola sp. Rm-C-2C1-2 TaxID=3141321 RepID=UPI0032E36C75
MHRDAGLLALLWLAGLYMRLPILVAPALAPAIADELTLSQTHIGALTTLPVLMLALGALMGSLLIMRLGPRNALVAALGVVAVMSAGRGLAEGPVLLLTASALMGLGIAVMQPSLPALLPRWLSPTRVALGSACYMNGMLMGEFVGAGLTLPVIMPLTGESWRLTLLVWSLPAALIALLLLVPKTSHNGGDGNAQWLPRLRDPLMWKLGLLLAGTSSLFFGTNAYMASVLEQRGELARLDATLLCFNFAQVAASTLMLWMARQWVGRRGPILWSAGLSVTTMLGFILVDGWVGVAFAVLMSFFAGILLILIVSLPPQLVSSSEAGKLSAGNFTIGYTFAFVIPLIGGVAADTSGQALAAVGFITLFSAATVPLALRLKLPH